MKNSNEKLNEISPYQNSLTNYKINGLLNAIKMNNYLMNDEIQSTENQTYYSHLQEFQQKLYRKMNKLIKMSI